MLSYKHCLLLFLVCLFVAKTSAQVNADFTMDKDSICSGGIVTFTNATTGASTSATYIWNFGNGNGVTNNNLTQSAKYDNQQTYTVTLTVTDNGNQYVKSKNVTVYTNPTASFIVIDSVGCTPLKINFTSTSLAGSGLLNSFSWDFGDGTVLSGDSTLKTVSHAFTFSGLFTIKLNVQSTTGCNIASLVKTNFINAKLTPTAAYTRNKSFLCKSVDSVAFTNTSKNTNQATYLWSFGDQTVSSLFAPTHIYNTKGSFQDSLIVTNDNGCADTAISLTPVFNGKSDAKFTSSGLCAKTDVLFTNISNPKPDASTWSFSNNSTKTNGLTTTNYFNTSGNYSITLINSYGSCKDTSVTQVSVVKSFPLDAFETIATPICNGKTSVQLIDTTSGGKAWTWSIKGNNDTVRTDTATYLLQNDNTYYITLVSKQASGCLATVTESVSLPKSSISIASKSNDSLSNTSGCAGLKIDFSTKPASKLKSYLWDFGDGNTSTDPTPSHVYNSVGIYPVELTYQTTTGCTDTIWLRNIQTFSKPVPSFSTPIKIHCGAKANFYDLTPSPVNYWTWNFGDNSSISHDENPAHSFKDTGYFDIQLIAFNGTCFDSVTYPKYIYILPPIIGDTLLFSCDGNRDTINFKLGYKYVEKASIDFGDGSVTLPLTTTTYSVAHQFPKSGVYLTQFTASYGKCTITDSLYIPVLTKQFPKIHADVTEICENDSLKVYIDTTTLQPNPSVGDFRNFYDVFEWQTNDTTAFNGSFTAQPRWYFNKYFGKLSSMPLGNDSFRVILKSTNYGCLDTSVNYIYVKVKGPIPNFTITNPKECFKLPITFTDHSKPYFSTPPIKTWIWNFGDSTIDTTTTGAPIFHTYSNPGAYVTYLKVVDGDGCYAETSGTDSAFPKGPKADFIWNPPYVVTNTTANFINTSNTFEDSNISYHWAFTSTKLTATSNDTSIFYPNAIIDTVTLIAKDVDPNNPTVGCLDTVSKRVVIKNVFALFTFKTEYIGKNSSCPPLIATFQSNSVNADMIRWNFGDGTPGSGITADSTAKHQYENAGTYIIWLYAYKNGALKDSISDSIIIKGSFAKLHTDVVKGCVPTSVNFYVTESNSLSYTWDFGDGVTIKDTKDTSESHQYRSAGLYTPYVSLIDINGCMGSFSYPYRLLIDTLHTSFAPSITPICDSGIVSFVSKTLSLSNDSLQTPLVYHWDLGTGNPKDTSNLSNPTFFYRIGKYPVSQTITSIAGCVASFTDTISVVRSARGTVAGPVTTCDSIPATFTGSVVNKTDSVAWLWKFGNGDTSHYQNPKPVYFTTGKDSIFYDTVLLITQLNNCYDTTPFPFVVNPRPFVGLQSDTNKICIGLKDTLMAHDGNNYSWFPKVTLINDSTMSVQPKDTTKYIVTVKNQYGCQNKDSTIIKVVKKLPTIPLKNADVCIRKSIQLPVFGADSYRWLADIATIKAGDLNSASPTITPVVSPTIYAVERTNECFIDTPKITVTLRNYPTITTRDTLTLLTGSVVQLQTNVSPDVITYQGSPADYLNCTDCATPVSTPRSDITYTVVAANKYGCTATTNLKISLLCSNSLFIPTAFTPAENINNVFYPLGRGVRVVTHFMVYDRLGYKVFEKNNIQINDKTAGWDGTIYGSKAPPGTYVYAIEAICDTGETLPMQKGTVVLIR